MTAFPGIAGWPPVWSAGRAPRRILFTRAWAARWAWLRRPAFLGAAGPRRPLLFAGPWVGEFGWELMNWQALLRALRPRYERVIVAARESSRALYDGLCDEFVPHEVRGQANAHVVFDIANPEELRRILAAVPAGADHLPPLAYVPAEAQAFVRLGDPGRAPAGIDVLVHARGRESVPGRNWSVGKWTELADALGRAGFRVGAVGLASDTLGLPDVADFRDRPLGGVMDLMAAAKLVVGPSSGPMHLASLCGAPHLVWTDRRTYGMGRTSREKYETWWNPLGTPVRVLDGEGFDPSVAAVLDGATTLLRGADGP
jgi:ADP-heptose:LPS heptosyltransferase